MENMFTLTPMSQNIELVPGGTYSGSLTVASPMQAGEPLDYQVEIAGYNISGDSDVDFSGNTAYTAITDWITVDNPTGTVQPNGSETITYTINVPEDAEPGGQYAVITVGSSSNNVGNDTISVNNVYQIASILYARVSGEITRAGEIVSNEFPTFFTSLPFRTKTSFRNNGNIHETATVSIKIVDHFSNQVVYPAAEEPGKETEEIIMPNTERTIETSIAGLPELGVFDVTQTIDYLGDTSTTSHLVIFCPIWFIFAVIVIILGFIGMISGIVITQKKARHLKKSTPRPPISS